MSVKFGTSFCYIEYFNFNKTVYIDVLFVAEEYRDKGLAKKLMESFIEYCCNNNKTKIYLFASSELGADLERLKLFYEKFGFERENINIAGMNNINMYLSL